MQMTACSKIVKSVFENAHALNSGHFIPYLGLGTYLSLDNNVKRSVADAVACGYRMIDTAKYYHNEAEIGEALQRVLPANNLKRKDIFLTTKVMPQATTSLTHEDVEDSLKRLSTDYLDLVLVHYPRNYDNCEDNDPRNREQRRNCWIALQEIQANGKIRSIGVSSYEPRHIEEMMEYSNAYPSVNQQEIHPHFQRNELRDYCLKNGIFFQAFSPLGRASGELLNDPVVQKVAKTHKTTAAVILLRWSIQKGVGVVPKSINTQRIAENFKALSLELDEKEMEALNGLDQEKPYVEDCGWLVA
ncbi:unnamed protein product [Caenorhabditis auriculariae]|uniref:NADP-dependent oxidoreductase domain-containing protein n=1 Tax=Caenorhabditis auriculariae TaxID=2777116 RepID=A0A8S1HTX9_9PELO|nr:unnamed protein product [Caenorhabditis auriculariae]